MSLFNITDILADLAKRKECDPSQVKKCVTTPFGKEVCKCENTDASNRQCNYNSK